MAARVSWQPAGTCGWTCACIGHSSRCRCAGCHCATSAHHDLALTPPASCRISFALYTNDDDIARAADALRRVVRTVRPNSAQRTAAKAARIGTGTPP
jgi:hypothetical protein